MNDPLFITIKQDTVDTGCQWLGLVLITNRAQILFSEDEAKDSAKEQSFDSKVKGEKARV
jgi:hypothetical protein